MRTPKIEALYRLIDWLNARSRHGLSLTKLPLDDSPIESNAWFAGFIDSDGSFSIKGFSSNSLRTYLGFQFYLPQRAISVSGKSSEMFMQKLANYLNCKFRGFTIYWI